MGVTFGMNLMLLTKLFLNTVSFRCPATSKYAVCVAIGVKLKVAEEGGGRTTFLPFSWLLMFLTSVRREAFCLRTSSRGEDMPVNRQ